MTHTKQAIKLGLAALNCALLVFIFASMAHGQEQTPITVQSAKQIPTRPNGAIVEVTLQLPNKRFMTMACNVGVLACIFPRGGDSGFLYDSPMFTPYKGTNVEVCYVMTISTGKFFDGRCGVYILESSF